MSQTLTSIDREQPSALQPNREQIAAPTTPPSANHTCENCGNSSLQLFTVPDRARLWHCPSCELYQGGTLPTAAVYEDEYHDGYLKSLPRKVMTARVRLSRVRPLLDYPTVNDPPITLDIGCSIGATVTAAKELGWDAHGVDVSQSAVDSCRERGLNCESFDGGRLPYEDATFDLITSWHVIEHVTDVSETLAEWYRVLRPGGLLILETPHAKCWKAKLLGPRYRKFWPAEHLYTFTPENLSPFIVRTGLEPLPLPLVVWPRDMNLKHSLYSVAHQSYLAATKMTNFCKAFQIVARRPWSSVEGTELEAA